MAGCVTVNGGEAKAGTKWKAWPNALQQAKTKLFFYLSDIEFEVLSIIVSNMKTFICYIRLDAFTTIYKCQHRRLLSSGREKVYKLARI